MFASLGCLYSEVNDCGDGDALYPMAGGGIIFNLKPDAGIVMRLEYAQGKDDNSATYLSLGHPF